MKKIFTFPNIQAALLLAMTVAETVLMILFKPMPIFEIVLVQIGALLCIGLFRFAYKIAFLSNRWHSLWNRKNSDEKDDEPSDLAVGITKAVGYIALLILQIFLFI